ncbi:MAG TPA: nitronate monooxygenase, partial [Fermentimonas sp.]|nr:nitronate monooxygenase [Fermentimonas sp.]
FALKSAEAGVDAIVAEGFEAGGHNGREETTTLTLIPQVRKVVNLPLIAAGGISSGESMAAVMALGAEGVQVGTRFALTEESSASEEFKQRCISLEEGDTSLSLKKVTPVRLIKNEFYHQVKEMEDRGATAEELRSFLGRGRSKKGIFEGDLIEGELEIGQIASDIKQIVPAKQVIEDMVARYNKAIELLATQTL